MDEPAAQRAGKPTLSDVASRAGVSLTTASFVLGGKAARHRISERTARRIRHAARELDYSPNLLVRSMQSGSTGIISFFNAFRNRLPNDLYMDRLSTAMENATGQRGFNVLVQCHYSSNPAEDYAFLNGGHSDGLLFFAPSPDDPLLPYLRTSRLPCVLVGSEDPEGVISSVKDDTESGMRQLAERLIALGHHRIVGIGERDLYADSEHRLTLLASMLEHAGQNGLDFRVEPWSGDSVGQLRSLLARNAPPTAIFCWRDFIAYRLLEASGELGIPVPDRLSIIGYDGLPWPAKTSHTAASVQVNLNELSEAAVELLLQRIQTDTKEVVRHRIPVRVLEGSSLGQAPAF